MPTAKMGLFCPLRPPSPSMHSGQLSASPLIVYFFVCWFSRRVAPAIDYRFRRSARAPRDSQLTLRQRWRFTPMDC
jgi:hypothetical protein